MISMLKKAPFVKVFLVLSRGHEIMKAASASPPMGRLRKKIQRQVVLLQIAPEISGPAIPPTVMIIPIEPATAPPFSGGTALKAMTMVML